MGCNSSTAKKSTPPSVEEPTQAQPPTLTEETAQERALVQLKLVFDSIDANHDHAVSKVELEAALKKDEKQETLGPLVKDSGLNLKYNDLTVLGTKQDGCISWEEFLGHLQEKAVEEVKATGELAAAEIPATEKALKQLKAVFDSIDVDGDGGVSKEELSAKLNGDRDEHGLMKEESFGQLVMDAGYNPYWNAFEKLVTKKTDRITWDEFENNLKLIDAAVKEVKETGEISSAVVVQETLTIDDGPAPVCGCWRP